MRFPSDVRPIPISRLVLRGPDAAAVFAEMAREIGRPLSEMREMTYAAFVVALREARRGR